MTGREGFNRPGTIIVCYRAAYDIARRIIAQNDLVSGFCTVSEKPILDENLIRNTILKGLGHADTVWINRSAFGHYAIGVIVNEPIIKAQCLFCSDIKFLTQNAVFVSPEDLVSGTKSRPRCNDNIVFNRVLNARLVELIFCIKFSGLISCHKSRFLNNTSH